MANSLTELAERGYVRNTTADFEPNSASALVKSYNYSRGWVSFELTDSGRAIAAKLGEQNPSED